MHRQAGYQRYVEREDRLRVMLPARMRSAAGWGDACILNISSRGLLVYSNAAAKPGAFVEIRRGRQLIVARVVWRQNRRIGLCSPDRVHVQDIISDEALAAAVQASGPSLERRAVPRAEGNRDRARGIEFVWTVLIATAIAGWAAIYVHQVLAGTMSTVRTALAGQ
jgi:hypothetical protein